jgi:N,N'-diacetyllegionaminate synthase
MGTLIIAEAGVNHNGNLETAYKMIDVAKEAGVDIVKFQTSVTSTSKVSEERNRSRRNAIGDDKKTSIFICSACSIKRILR